MPQIDARRNIISVILLVMCIGLGYALYVAYFNPYSAVGEDPHEWSWVLAPAGEDPYTGAPLTAVSLMTGASTYELGVYTGSCFEIENSEWELYRDELTGVICWFAGGGSEIGIFEEGDSFVVRYGQLDEGTAESPGFRGNFRELMRL